MKHIFDCVIVHYAEIGIKGNNRASFEKLLMNNIKSKLGNLVGSCVREFCQLSFNVSPSADIEVLKDSFSKIPGIAYFSFAKKCSLDVDKLKKEVVDLLKDVSFETFKVETNRHDKTFKTKSMELNVLLGDEIFKEFSKNVKLKNPELIVNVEITRGHAYVSTGKVAGVGGLPTNRKQKMVTLLSGGFDSPVAAFLMMKRGCEVILVHFQNQNQMTGSVQDKIIRLAEQLSKYQIRTKLFIVPFEDLQKEIIAGIHSEQRMLIYRRFMLRIASKIAKKEGAKFLVVGDSLSQVASQTIDNLECTYSAASTHVLSPVIGLDKQEIIDLSKKIGTHDISSLPYGDCCSFFLPKHPELKANAEMITKAESELEIDKLVNSALEKVILKEF